MNGVPFFTTDTMPGTKKDSSKNEKMCIEFINSLSQSEQMLITLRDELYEGSWNAMLEDLNARLNGKPYIFKLVNRIESDINGIKKIREFEEQNNVNLKDYL